MRIMCLVFVAVVCLAMAIINTVYYRALRNFGFNDQFSRWFVRWTYVLCIPVIGEAILDFLIDHGNYDDFINEETLELLNQFDKEADEIGANIIIKYNSDIFK